MDADDLGQVADSLRRAVEASPDAPHDAIVDFGWRELLVEDPEAAVSVLFTLQGRQLIPGTMLDEVLLQAAGVADLLGRARVVVPPLGAVRPASRLSAEKTIAVDGVVQAGSGTVLVPAIDASDHIVWVLAQAQVDAPASSQPLDPGAGWVALHAALPVEDVLDLGDGSQVWQDTVAAGRRAIAHELVAIGSAMLDMTVDHVTTREQFGRPLGALQAVKHQLAEVHLWQEVARLSTAAAWERPGSDAAALAHLAARRFSRSARASCQQLLGGMGFTWEHDFHRYLRRALTLEPLWGDLAVAHAELGAAVRRGTLSDSLASL